MLPAVPLGTAGNMREAPSGSPFLLVRCVTSGEAPMPSRQTAVFIDGGYWAAVLRDEFRLPRIDFAKLIEFMAAGNDLLRTYYYNCMPYQSNPATHEESERYGRARRFIDALSRLPRFEIRLGKLEYRGNNAADGKPIFEQKRVDIMLGVDMALL